MKDRLIAKLNEVTLDNIMLVKENMRLAKELQVKIRARDIWHRIADERKEMIKKLKEGE